MSTSMGEQAEAAALTQQILSNDATSPQQVPVHVVQAMREEIKALKEQQEAYKNHVEMMRWQQTSTQQQQAPAQPFANIDREDNIKAGVAIDALHDVESRLERKFNAQLAEVKLATQASDYKDVIQKYLASALQEDPDLRNELQHSSNPVKAALYACKASKAYQEDLIKTKTAASSSNKQSQDLDRAIANSKTSGNLSTVGNQATAKSSPNFGQMTDEEFRSFKARNMIYGGRKGV